MGDDSCMNAAVINDDDNPVTVQADASVPDGRVAVFDGTNHLSVSYANKITVFLNINYLSLM